MASHTAVIKNASITESCVSITMTADGTDIDIMIPSENTASQDDVFSYLKIYMADYFTLQDDLDKKKPALDIDKLAGIQIV